MGQTKKEIKALWDTLRAVDKVCRFCQSENVDLPYEINIIKIIGGGRFERFDFICDDCFKRIYVENIVCQCGFYNVLEIHNSNAEGYGGYFEWWVYHCSECGYAITRDYNNDFYGYSHKGMKNEGK